jgi:ribosomal protein S18 acetylase RimI-like enzyme
VNKIQTYVAYVYAMTSCIPSFKPAAMQHDHKSDYERLRHAVLRVRRGTDSDADYLAQAARLATIPPFEDSFWDDVAGSKVGALALLGAALRARLFQWGQVEDHIIIELDKTPMASCAVYKPFAERESYRPLSPTGLLNAALACGWTFSAAEAALGRYLSIWPDEDMSEATAHAAAIIESVNVMPEAQGLGLGKTLILEALQVAKDSNASNVGLTTLVGNDRAQSLYESLGFQATRAHAPMSWGTEVPGLLKFRMSLERMF